LVDQFGNLDDALAFAAGQARLKAGDWHPLYLGEERNGYQTLLERMTTDEDASPPDEGDIFAILASRQQAALARAMVQTRRMLGSSGMQAYCLECPAPAGRPAPPAARGGLLVWLRDLGL